MVKYRIEKFTGTGCGQLRQSTGMVNIDGACLSVIGLCIFLMCSNLLAADQTTEPAKITVTKVQVKPVILIPSDTKNIPYWHGVVLLKHLEWARARYQELLQGKDTFSLAEGEPLELKSRHSSNEFLAAEDGGAAMAVLELMAHDKVGRFNCPFIYVVMVENTGRKIPGGGRPINGYVNTGGGVFIASADTLELPNFQSTLQHELGHSFGLVHVDAYGYSMKDNASIMSYNEAHHTDGWKPSKTSGGLIPEDYRLLGLNRRVFPNFRADPKLTPANYKLFPTIVMLPPMKLNGQPDYTTSGSAEFPR